MVRGNLDNVLIQATPVAAPLVTSELLDKITDLGDLAVVLGRPAHASQIGQNIRVKRYPHQE